jgi:hypothetical protein
MLKKLAQKGAFYTRKISRVTPENQRGMEHFKILMVPDYVCRSL